MELNNVKGFAKLTYRDLLKILQNLPDERLDNLAIVHDTYHEESLFVMRAKFSDSGRLYLEV